MANPAGESNAEVLRLDFDRRLPVTCGSASTMRLRFQRTDGRPMDPRSATLSALAPMATKQGMSKTAGGASAARSRGMTPVTQLVTALQQELAQLEAELKADPLNRSRPNHEQFRRPRRRLPP
jgi:hypothetical protein